MAFPPRATTRCDFMAGDIERLANMAAHYGDAPGRAGKLGGAIFGPRSRSVHYDVYCERVGKFGAGNCSVYRLTRHASTGKTLREAFGRDVKPEVWTGNLHGLVHQLSRDVARLWGCKKLAESTGFEGAKSGKGRRRKARHGRR